MANAKSVEAVREVEALQAEIDNASEQIKALQVQHGFQASEFGQDTDSAQAVKEGGESAVPKVSQKVSNLAAHDLDSTNAMQGNDQEHHLLPCSIRSISGHNKGLEGSCKSWESRSIVSGAAAIESLPYQSYCIFCSVHMQARVASSCDDKLQILQYLLHDLRLAGFTSTKDLINKN